MSNASTSFRTPTRSFTRNVLRLNIGASANERVTDHLHSSLRREAYRWNSWPVSKGHAPWESQSSTRFHSRLVTIAHAHICEANHQSVITESLILEFRVGSRRSCSVRL